MSDEGEPQQEGPAPEQADGKRSEDYTNLQRVKGYRHNETANGTTRALNVREYMEVRRIPGHERGSRRRDSVLLPRPRDASRRS